MSNPNIPPTLRAAIVGVINPQSLSPGSASTGWIDMGLYNAAAFSLLVGAITSNGTVDAKFEQATTSGGDGVKDVTGKAITQLTQAGTDANKQAQISVRSDELDTNNGFRWLRATVTTATAAALLAGILQAFDHRYTPTNATTVDSNTY